VPASFFSEGQAGAGKMPIFAEIQKTTGCTEHILAGNYD
jgi:hypothetical protein